MIPVAELTDVLSVAGQIQPGDVADLAASGYTAIICNRPDDEESGQPSMDAVAAACEQVGVTFVRYPVTALNFPGDDLTLMDDAMNSGDKTLAYCRSGARSANLWVATQAGDARTAAVERAQQFGIPLSFVMQLGS
ncbi:MAG TPA: TIGR01244 family phosphatase [Halieaceae bacterium]|nr:TIGR01244 family phosphatase [Pseudomonadales bacterium]MBL6901767.1 TIGR01244 family phosphatase [Luminiphilus sp.]HBQ02511.1 TIGR01244 family phosphatase [Halieaceae bacterium]